jgi:alpha-tubulin suppressor-like RCC1 family protein
MLFFAATRSSWSAMRPARAAGSLRFQLVLALALGAGGGCKTGTEPLPAAATQLALAVAPAAVAQSGALLAPQPVIQLQDAQGNPVAVRNKVVLVALAAPGGTLTGTLQAKSDDAGRATFTNLAIAGPVGPRRLRFDSQGLLSVTSATIQLEAGSAAALAPVAGNLQTAVAGSAVPVPPSVRVTDGAGNPLAGVAVSFVPSSGGSVSGGQAVSGADGVAAPVQWILATTIGLNTLTATSPAVPAASVSFTATGTVGPPAILTAAAGEGQIATVAGATPIAPAVLLTDAAGHPLPGVAVTFAVTSGGGSLTGANALTDAGGIATLGSWTLGLPPGPNALSVTRAGVPPLTLHATGIDFPVQAVSGGAATSCALDPDGKAFCWGNNASGQVGNGNTVDVRLPNAVLGGLLFGSISAGAGHTCALLADGDAYCWGDNGAGQLGDASLVSHNLPLPVSGGLKFASIHTGAGFTCALALDGVAYCWGLGTSGQLGDNTVVSKRIPTAVFGGHLFSALSAGASHACAIDTAGALFCWGNNASGRLGDGTTVNRPAPTPVNSPLSYTAVTAGGAFSCAIAAGGAGYCWGSGVSGLLGNGTTSDQLAPAAVTGGLLFTGISARSTHTCALTAVQQAYCWGLNTFGQLGDGTTALKLVPTAVAGGLGFTAVQVGAEHSCGRATTGGAYCWGRNDLGAVGDNSVIARSKPVGVVRP